MILNVKIEIDKSKENYQAVLSALEAFDIASASWEDKATEYKVETSLSGKTDPNDLSAAVSAAVDRQQRKRPTH